MTSPTTPTGRFCPVCSKVDGTARHQIAGTVDSVAPHLECCAKVGCPDGSCPIVTSNDSAAKQAKALADRPVAVARFTLDDLDMNVHGGLAAGGAPTEMGLADR